jgi:signal peptidase I
MEPTLLGKNGAGDKIVVSKFQYRMEKPRRDDVVVFLAPPAAMAGDPPYVKRLIGLPGDRMEAVAGVVTVGGRSYNHTDVRQALAVSGEFGPDAQANPTGDLQSDHHVKFVPGGVLADGRRIGPERLAQILTGMAHAPVAVRPGYVVRNGQRLAEPFTAEDPDYDLKLFEGQPLKHEHGPAEAEYHLGRTPLTQAEFARDYARPTGAVPPGRYLMMGDNRNDSDDSTNWGPLEARRVVGHAQAVFWPLSRLGVIR